MGYLANFMVYTFAMVGVIAVALLIFKNSTSMGGGSKSKYLKIVDSLSISPRKRLYVISTGKEKFLIAGDVDKTTLISKLESPNFEETHSKIESIQEPILNSSSNIGGRNFEYPIGQSFKDTMANLPGNNQKSYMDKMDNNNLGIKSSFISNSSNETPYTSVIRSLAVKMKQ